MCALRWRNTDVGFSLGHFGVSFHPLHLHGSCVCERFCRLPRDGQPRSLGSTRQSSSVHAFPGKRAGCPHRDGEGTLCGAEELQHLRVQGREENGVRSE